MAPRRRGPNKALRDARVDRGWTLDQTAKWVTTLTRKLGYLLPPTTRSSYERYETKGVVPEPPRMEAICLMFKMAAKDLGFPAPPDALQGYDDVPRLPAGIGPKDTSDPAQLDIRSIVTSVLDLLDSDEMRRRAFLALIASGAAGGLDVERLAAVLAGSRPEERAFDDLETLMVELVRQEASLAAGSLLPAVRGHLRGVQDLLIWTPPSLAARAHSLAGQTALLAGYLVFKLGRHTEADSYWSLAAAFGDAAGDTRLQAAVAILRGWRWGAEDGAGDHVRAISLLNAAEPLATDPGVAAVLLAFRAQEHAKAREFDSGHEALALRDIDQAQECLSRIPADERVYIFESAKGEVASVRGKSFVYLDRPRDAAADLENVATSIPATSLAWRSDVQVNLAAVHTKMDAPDSAANLLSDALQLAVTAGAPRCVDRVRKYRRRWLSGFDALPAVRRLDEQLRTLGPPARGALPG